MPNFNYFHVIADEFKKSKASQNTLITKISVPTIF